MEHRHAAKMHCLVDSRLGWSSDVILPDPQWESALLAVGNKLPLLLMSAVKAQTHTAWMVFKRRIEAAGITTRMLGSRPLQYFVNAVRMRSPPTYGGHTTQSDESYMNYLIAKHHVPVDDRVLMEAARVTRKQCPGMIFHLARF